ncbi:MAG: PhnD/SsuA/transferrin family substrate-binding protein [Amylibacter sp.]|nr:PhnD/SsuA/transferrin family substrate-binding protein [Amylibacter sp.]
MIASLTMYARPETDASIDVFWQLLRTALRDYGVSTPEMLSQEANVMDVWTDPRLVIGQTCGMPFRKFLHGKVHLVGTPHFNLSDCPAGHYHSVVVVRKDDARQTLADYAQAPLAYNDENSQSGFAAILNHAAAKGVAFSDRLPSGGHVNSSKMVVEGNADIASLDAVTWKLIQRYDPWASDLRVLENTKPFTPTLPFITSLDQDPDLIFDALDKAISALPATDKEVLCLNGILQISATEYLKVPNPVM